LYDLLVKVLAHDVRCKPSKILFGDKPIFKSIGDPSKLKSIGWKPKYSIDDLINELINENI
jgi:GDP-D-mannose dehydratase